MNDYENVGTIMDSSSAHCSYFGHRFFIRTPIWVNQSLKNPGNRDLQFLCCNVLQIMQLWGRYELWKADVSYGNIYKPRFVSLPLYRSKYYIFIISPATKLTFYCWKREPPWLLDLETSILIRQPKFYSTTSQSWLELEWFVRDLLFIQTLEPWVLASCIRAFSAHFIHSRVTSRLFYKGSPVGAFVLTLHELAVWLPVCYKGSSVHKLYSFLLG